MIILVLHLGCKSAFRIPNIAQQPRRASSHVDVVVEYEVEAVAFGIFAFAVLSF